jgi:hypothetical protein
MNPFTAGIRQHDTHNELATPTKPQSTSLTRLGLDAIIVPASRPAAHLDHAITLARAAGCWLLILCSRRCHGPEVRELLAARSCRKAIVVDLPTGYSHELLNFPALLALQDELPEACGYITTDLSMKRNVGLVLARMLGWRRIFFLDDDIRDITYPDLQSTVNMLGPFAAAGLWVTDYPDNSVVCHANRLTDGNQDVFVSGAALAVDCDADTGFFPDIYNEDWLFFFDNASSGRLANSGLKATQLCYYPFARAQRAAWQEFGDVLAEGLYGLLHLGLGWQHATRDYWAHFLEARRIFLEGIITRSKNAHHDMRAEMVASVLSALKCLQTIKPDLCERYVRQWRQDLADWKQRVADIPKMPSIEAALKEMQLTSSAWVSGTGKIPYRREEPTPNIAAGAVVLPRFDTLKDLSGRIGALDLRVTAPSERQRGPKRLTLLISEHSDEHRRRLKQRFDTTMAWLGVIRDVARPSRRTPALSDAPESELEPIESGALAEPERV